MEGYSMSQQAKDLLQKVNGEWRNMDRVIPLMNAVVTGYIIAVSKVLGRGATAMSQMLIKEIGDVIAEMVDQILGDKQLKYNVENRAELIKSALLEMGICKDVEVISEGKENEETHIIKIKDSIFLPTHMVLVHQGYKEFPLSPEGLICAAIVRKVLRTKEGGNAEAQVRVNTKLPTDEKTLIVEIKEVKAK
ncbi:hypothetical protein [Methanocaldococcus lauensis]|uniref:hypothetical protein n=1 Tax=Methanocaldococcus lauensis TaxID=2546128 RepID=UPI0020298F7A|nr:hypothetical protein [Methanocaldococcus lauensis]